MDSYGDDYGDEYYDHMSPHKKHEGTDRMHFSDELLQSMQARKRHLQLDCDSDDCSENTGLTISPISARNIVKNKTGSYNLGLFRKIKTVSTSANWTAFGASTTVDESEKNCHMAKHHRLEYLKSKKRIDLTIANIEEILDLQDTLKRKRIMCYKYNYSLEDIV